MRAAHFLTTTFVMALIAGCSGKGGSGFGEDSGLGPDGEILCAPDDPFCNPNLGDGGGEAAPPCEGIACDIANCGTTNGTTISGKVYDPAGKNPLYNVYVYVPNFPLADIPDSGPVCTQCQAPASGKPIADAVTNEKGEFLIKNAPAGAQIPLVMQVGKWRRRIVIPQVGKCANTALSDPNVTRLPRRQKEGSQWDNIPRIAFTTGCDNAECFLLKRIGIADSEFTGPGGTGRVHVYAGSGYSFSIPNGIGSLTALYNSLTELKKYDIVFSACECDVLDRGSGYQNIKAYLTAGGRYFGTHYFYNVFANPTQCAVESSYAADTCKGDADFNAVANWVGDGYGSSPQFLNVDTTHPKGQAMMAWLNTIAPISQGALILQGNSVQLYDLRMNATDATPSGTTRYLYKSPYNYYFSWNVPTKAMPDKQCGRSVFSGVHLSGTSASGAWPTRCGSFPLAQYGGNELALEFLFFDLSSCVSDDTKPPIYPPPN